MSRGKETERPAPEKLKLTLIGRLTPEEMAELASIVEGAVPKPKRSKAKYRPAEFPDEIVEQVTEDIQRDSANNEVRETERAANPPKPDELDRQLAELRRQVIEAVRDYVETCGPIKVKAVRPQ